MQDVDVLARLPGVHDDAADDVLAYVLLGDVGKVQSPGRGQQVCIGTAAGPQAKDELVLGEAQHSSITAT